MFFSRVITTSLVIPVVIGISACNREGEGTRGRTRDAAPDTAADTAHVRYVNALTAQAGAELYLGDSKLTGGQTEISYMQVPAERRTFALRAAGQTEPLATNNEGLRRGGHYTVIAYDDEDGKATLRVVNDMESEPSRGKAKIRLIDASPRTDDFGLYVAGRAKGDKLAGEPLIGAISRWMEVDPVSEPLELRRRADKAAAPVPVPNVSLTAGRLYTFVVTDGRTASEPPQVITLENEPTKIPITNIPAVPPAT
jgi:hypothetical protein